MNKKQSLYSTLFPSVWRNSFSSPFNSPFSHINFRWNVKSLCSINFSRQFIMKSHNLSISSNFVQAWATTVLSIFWPNFTSYFCAFCTFIGFVVDFLSASFHYRDSCFINNISAFTRRSPSEATFTLFGALSSIVLSFLRLFSSLLASTVSKPFLLLTAQTSFVSRWMLMTKVRKVLCFVCA